MYRDVQNEVDDPLRDYFVDEHVVDDHDGSDDVQDDGEVEFQARFWEDETVVDRGGETLYIDFKKRKRNQALIDNK